MTSVSNNSIKAAKNMNKKLFIGGLPFNTTEHELLEFFGKYGKIIKVEIPKQRKSEKPRGFGFIYFEKSSSALRAMENRNVLRGKKMTLRIAMCSKKARNHTKELQNLKTFAKGFPLYATEADIEIFFSRFGVVNRVLMGNSSRREEFKGFAYIIMEEKQGYQNVFNSCRKGTCSLDFNGRTIEIQQAKIQKEINEELKIKSKHIKENKRRKMGSNSSREYGSSISNNNYSNSNSDQSSFRLKNFSDEMSIVSSSSGSDYHPEKLRFKGRVRRNSQIEDENILLGNRFSSNSQQNTNQNHHQNVTNDYWNHRNHRRTEIGQETIQDYTGYYLGRGENFHSNEDLNSLTGQELYRRHHLVWRNDYGDNDNTPEEEITRIEHGVDGNFLTTSTNHQNMNFTSFTTGGEFSNTSRPLPQRTQMFGPHNAFGDNISDPNFMREGNSEDFIAQNYEHQSRGNVNYYGPVFIPGYENQEEEEEVEREREQQPDSSVEIKQTIVTEYFVKNNGVIYHGTINETNIWGSHPHQSY